MEHIIKKEHYDTPLYQILPSAEAAVQSLQIVLMPNQIIYCPKNSVLYSSKKVDLTLSHFNMPRSENGKKAIFKMPSVLFTEPIVKAENRANYPGYIGLNGSGGKIIIINPLLQPNMVINSNYLLAHSDNVCLGPPTGNEIFEVIPNIGQKFLKVEIEQRENRSVAAFLEAFAASLNPESAERGWREGFLFLQSRSNFIEKDLGPDQEITIRFASLVAFESGTNQSVGFKKIRADRHLMHAVEFVRIKGPGLIYFETETPLLAKSRKAPFSMPSSYQWGILIIILLLAFDFMLLSILVVQMKDTSKLRNFFGL